MLLQLFDPLIRIVVVLTIILINFQEIGNRPEGGGQLGGEWVELIKQFLNFGAHLLAQPDHGI